MLSAPSSAADINLELLTFRANVYKAVSRKWNATFQMKSSLILCSSNQPSPHRNVSMETSPIDALALELQRRESPDETSHKGDTHADAHYHP